VFTKRHYINVTPEGKIKSLFAMFILQLARKRILIQYIGDCSKAVQYPHGNSKCKTPYSFSGLNKAKTSMDSPANVYKKLISNHIALLMCYQC